MITAQWFKLRHAWRLWCARHRGVLCGPDVKLAAGVDFNLGRDLHQSLRPAATAGRITLGGGCWLEQGCVLWAFDGHITLQPSVFLGPYVVIYGHGGVEIGERTLVAMHCVIVSSNHTVPPAGVVLRDQPDILQPTRIGRDCWLGAGVKVMAGVTIGDGCVVGAGSVVTKDLPAHAIAHGVPALVVGSR
jgi:acetyltransferase-like isoleucine patch superfamily enzyme